MDDKRTPIYWEDASAKLRPLIQSSGSVMGLSITWREISLLLGIRKMFYFYKDAQGKIICRCPYCGEIVQEPKNEKCQNCQKRSLLYI